MTMHALFALVLGVTVVTSGCTRSRQPVTVENPKTNGSNQGQNTQQGGGGNAIDTQEPGDGTATVALEQEELRANYQLDTSNLTYRFEYLTKTQADKITFDAAGKSILKFRELPAEQSGTVKLEILEAGVVKLVASQDNVSLKKGQETSISLKLTPAGGGSIIGGSTDLSIEVTLDNQGGGSVPTPITPTPITPTPITPTPITPTPADPIADWNGKEHKGNSKWTIISVQ